MIKKKMKLVMTVTLFAAAVNARVPNYDESKVAPYLLEDPLTFADGRKLKDVSEWPSRRREILDIFAREMYGVEPPAPEAVVTELREEGSTLAGLAIRRQYRMWFKPDKSGPFIDWLLVLPNRVVGTRPETNGVHIVCENREKVPVVLMLNYPGNHAVLDEAEVSLTEGGWFDSDGDSGGHEPKESNRGVLRRSQSRTTVPAEFIVSRGYAFLTACYAQVSPDVEVKKGDPEELAYTRIFELWPKRDESRTDNTTALGAWAWALSRGLDLAETIPEIDAKRCVATGSSRLGKAALLAAARDERFAVCVPNQTGGGGVPLAKRDFGENVSTEMASFPHWYCKAYAKYIDNEQAMKFDQHLLVAAIAPRALLVEGFNQGWFDTKGEWLACRAASPVWEFLEKEGLPKGDFPDNYDRSCIGASLGYVRRGGQHGLSGYDWLWMLDFADQIVKSQAPTSFAHGANLETETLQAQIDAASKRGGGRVVVTAGRHLTGQLYLRNNVELHLEAGAVLEGAVGLHNYVVHYLPFSEGAMSAVVMGLGVTNVAITGSGEIFGNGREFERVRTVGGCEEGFRPRGIFIGDSKNVLLEDFTLRDAACWGIVIQRCEDVVARKVKVDSVINVNNDGFDIEARNVLLEDCDVQSGDDGYCIKSNDPDYVVENIVVRNCRVSSHCTTMKLGTATHGTMRNIRFEHIVVTPPRRFFRDLIPMPEDLTKHQPHKGVPGYLCGPAMAAICVECVDGGVVENVVFDDIEVSGASVPVHIRGGFRSGRACGTPPRNEKILRGIVISNLRGRAEQARPSTILGCDACRVSDVTLRNVDIECVGEGAERNDKPYSIPGEDVADMYPDAFMFKDYHLPSYGLFADHADGIRLENVCFTLRKGTTDSRPAIAGVDSAASAAPEVSWSIMHPTGIDVKYMERVAAKAAEYGGVDSFEVCGPCHSPDGGINGLSMLEPYPKAHARVDAASVEAARAKMNAIVSIAHGIGKPLYYWHREIFLQPGIIEDLPQMLDEDGEFDLLGSTYQDYLRFKIQETFKFVPGLDGIVLTLTEADYSVIHNSNPERYPPAKVVEAIVRIFAEEHARRGKKFILRSFGSIAKDYEDIIAGAVAVAKDPAPALLSLGAGGFEIETKVTQADFVPWLSKNPFLKRNPPLTLGAECDCVGEYLGAGFLPSVQVSRIHGYVADARAEGSDRFTIRIDRVGNSIFDTAAEANLYAYMRFIKDPGATVEGVLAEYAAKHYGDAAEEMAKLEGTELEMVRNIHYVASNLTFHTFPMKPDFKYVKAGGIFGAYHENADLSNCRESWSMLYWQKAPTHERILAEKAKGLEMAERGLSLVKSLRGRLPSAEYTRLVRAWENAVKVARALQAYTRCVVAYFEDMKADRDVPERLESASSEAVKLIESMMRNPNAYDDDKFHPVTEDGSVDYAYFVGLRFFCKELLAEYKAERAARRTLQSRLDVLDFIVPGGIYDDGRVLRPMHGAHSEIVGGWPVRWVGNAVFPNGTITVDFKDVPGAKLEIALDPSGSQEYKCSESVEAGRRRVVISKKGASYPAIRSISLVSSK